MQATYGKNLNRLNSNGLYSAIQNKQKVPTKNNLQTIPAKDKSSARQSSKMTAGKGSRNTQYLLAPAGTK
jgi:hypothetical protein